MGVKPESQADLERLQRGPGKTKNQRAIEALAAEPGGDMNQWETTFSLWLDAEKEEGRITWWAFQPINLRLPGARHFYKPDFMAMEYRGLYEVPKPPPGMAEHGLDLPLGAFDIERVPAVVPVFYEVKGFLREKARNKIKLAATWHPWATFRVAFDFKSGGGFQVRTIEQEKRGRSS